MAISWAFLVAFFGYQFSNLKADFEFEKFFPKNDPDIEFYETHLEKFSYDNDYLIAILSNDQGVFDQTFLQKTKQLTDSLRQLNGILNVFSPATLQQPVKGPMGVIPLPLIHIDEPGKYKSDSINIFKHPLFNTYFSKDGKSLILQINHQHFLDPGRSKSFPNQLDNVFTYYHFDHYRLVGKLAAQNAFVGYIQNDFVVFLVVALILSFILLTVIFRSVRIALLPYLISVTSLIFLLGIMSLLGYSISILGTLLPPVILFVSTSDAIHLINAYRSSEEKDFIKRLQLAYHKVFIPTLLTSVTTAVGFLSLCTIDTVPIQELGVFGCIGILIAFLVTFCLSPLLINQKYPEQKPSKWLKKSAIWVHKNQLIITCSWVALIAASIVGISHLQTDAYLLKDLPEDSQIRKDFALVDEQFGGSKPWEMAVWPVDSSSNLWNYETMLEMEKLHDHVVSEYPMDRLISPVTLLKYSNQMLNGGLTSEFKIPEHSGYDRTLSYLKKLQKRGLLPLVINEDGRYARFAGFIPEYGSHETSVRNHQLSEFIKQELNEDIVRTKLTGTTYLIDKSHELLSFNLIKGLLIGIGIIAVLLGLYFKSWKILLISLVPNILPLLAVAGYMGLTDTPLKLTTSVIFAVTFGIAVDDTIHFLAVYHRSKCESSVWKTVNTFNSAGKAIIYTTMIIISGFFLFTLSSFGATYYLGLFMTISLLIALLTDLTVLPLLLHLFQKTRK